MQIPPIATPEATAQWRDRHPAIPFRRLGSTGLWVSAAGFGGYRIDRPNATHRAALREALTRGINLVDTSANYTDGSSEQLVGELLQELMAGKLLERSEVVIVTKGGYLQGENFARSQQRRAAGEPWPDLVEYGPGLEHCLHPDFLADQITRSLERLQQMAIDVYLVHNPEYYLGWARKFDLPAEEARPEYERRLALAFDHLEKEVAAGRIRCYGISSNAFPNPVASPEFTSLDRVWQLANRVAIDHQFRVIQLPMNLLETGAATEANQPQDRSVLELAADLDIGVLVNRPLNAVAGSNLVRLADAPDLDQMADPELADGLIEELVNQEQRLQGAIFAIDIPFRTQQEFAATTSGGRLLRERWRGFGTLSNWRDVRDGYLLPRSRFAVQFARRRPELPAEAQGWVDDYERKVAETLAAITAVYQAEEQERLALIRNRAEQADPDWGGVRPFSQTAVRALVSTAGISSVLVGMRRPDYVHDVLTALEKAPPARNRRPGWEKLKAAQ